MYNILKNFAKSEQIFNVARRDSEGGLIVPSSFAMGSSAAEGPAFIHSMPSAAHGVPLGTYQPLTAYILYPKGEIFAVCPVLPYQANIAAAYFRLPQASNSASSWLDEVQQSALRQFVPLQIYLFLPHLPDILF